MYTDAIAVMTYNQPELVEALYEPLGSFMIVVDNGSTVEIPRVNIRIPTNLYFAGGWNYAMPLIEAEWVAMLNDDITGITLEMIDDLILSAERHGFDAISPSFNSPHRWSQPQNLGLREVPAIDWVATIVRKEAWDAVGGFDADNFLGYGSDLDIAYRLRKAGFRLAVNDRHMIYHIGGQAAIAGGTQVVQGSVAEMDKAFQRKYNEPSWTSFVQHYLLEEK